MSTRLIVNLISGWDAYLFLATLFDRRDGHLVFEHRAHASPTSASPRRKHASLGESQGGDYTFGVLRMAVGAPHAYTRGNNSLSVKSKIIRAPKYAPLYAVYRSPLSRYQFRMLHWQHITGRGALLTEVRSKTELRTPRSTSRFLIMPLMLPEARCRHPLLPLALLGIKIQGMVRETAICTRK